MGWVIFVLFVSTTNPVDWEVAIEKDHVFATQDSCLEFIQTSPSIAKQNAEWNTPDMRASWGCITADDLRDMGLSGAGETT